MKLLLRIDALAGRPLPGPELSRRELAALLGRILEALDLSAAGLSLSLMDDRGVAGLNERFLGCEGPTNILSFPAGQGAGADHLGELFLSVDTFERECFLYGQEPREHLARLLAHGVLHLAGHDHGPVMDELTDLAVEHALRPTALA